MNASTDPLIQLARVISPELRKTLAVTDELDEQDRQAYAKIAEARFAVLGTSVYPDATFTLRLSFGPVTSYEQGGATVPAMTTLECIRTRAVTRRTNGLCAAGIVEIGPRKTQSENAIQFRQYS